MTRLAGKTALITGGARGIGRAFADAYIREGARVAIADIDGDGARAAATELGDAAIALELDVTSQDSIDRAVADTIYAFGQIDILINNAALFTAAPIADIDRADYDRVFAVNVAGTLFTLQAVARHMIDAGVRGRIINMASQAGRRGEPLVAVYCATKAAIISLTQSAGLNLIQHGINVNAISPGVVDGAHWDGVDALFARYEGKPPGQKKKEVAASVPHGRMGRAEDLTGMAVFLASDEAEYIVAQTYNVDGGQWMS
ncbi:L-iditol 2-dehydrogenase [Actibacterium ureilyticum]|uniref:L-iditol 2-dehydrogenase n=1 Tax=Actibacterium ureilyticum TaxID=1590614 RepID=UPI000BAACB23|nr:L-iditol 2-dehydrogenase [Actibacterium ureilyticum]